MLNKKFINGQIIFKLMIGAVILWHLPIAAQMSSSNFSITTSVENEAGGAAQSTNFGVEQSVGAATESGESGSSSYLLNIGFIYQTFFEIQVVAELNLPDTSVSAGGSVYIPLTVSTDSSIGIAQFVVEFDSSVVQFSDTQIGADAPDFMVSTINTELPFDPSAPGTNKNVLVQISGGGQNTFSGMNQEIVLLEFNAVAASGTSPIVFDQAISHTFLTTENLNDLAGALLSFEDGSCAVTPGFNVSGAIQYYSNDNGVPNVNVNLDGYSASSDALGSFLISGVPGGDYSLEPSHQGNLGSSISAYDAAFVLQFVADLISFTPYQMVAADVSGNGGVSAFDASYILRYVAGLITEFPVAEEWMFIPAAFQIDENNWASAPDSIAYLPLDSDQAGQDFEGIVFGDVSGNWSPPGLELAAGQKNVTGSADVSWGELEFVDNQQFIAPVVMDVNGELYSAEMEIAFDSETLNLKEVRLGESLKDFYFEYSVDKNSLKLALAGARPLTSENETLILGFEVSDPKSSQKTELEIITANLNEGLILVDLSNNQLSLNPNVPTSTELFQNYPNPFNPETRIDYQLQEKTKVTIEVFNMVGQKIKTILNQEQNSGYHSVIWDCRDEAGKQLGSGVYLYRLKAGNYAKTRKMLVMK